MTKAWAVNLRLYPYTPHEVGSAYRMKILLLKPFLLARSNGGEISLIERLQRLKSFGWEVAIEIACPLSHQESSVSFLNERNTPLGSDNGYEISGLKCHVVFEEEFHPFELSAQKAMENFFWSKIDHHRPDFCVVHYTDFFAMTAAIKWNTRKTFVLQTDDEYPRLNTLGEFPSVKACAERISHFVVNSPFLKKQTKRDFPKSKSWWVPNPIITKPSLPHQSEDYWLFVNPIPVKGVEFMLDLAKDLPEENFLFVGNWTSEHPGNLPANVAWKPRQESLDPIFQKAKGLLMPSVWNEAFGRLALEAMQAEVPVISSDRGSLPFTVGSGGQSLPLELSRWKAALQKADANWRKEWIRAGQQHFKTYQKETTRRYQALRRLLESNLIQ